MEMYLETEPTLEGIQQSNTMLLYFTLLNQILSKTKVRARQWIPSHRVEGREGGRRNMLRTDAHTVVELHVSGLIVADCDNTNTIKRCAF